MGTCGQPGYVFRDFCLEQGIEFIIFCLNQGIVLSIFALNWVKCLKQGIKNRNSVLKLVGKSAIFVLNRVRVWGATPHLPTQGYIEYSRPGVNSSFAFILFKGLVTENRTVKWSIPYFWIPQNILLFAPQILHKPLFSNALGTLENNGFCKIWGANKKYSGILDHFTVVCLVAWPLNESEAGVDLALIETSLLFLCKYLLISMRTTS